MQREPLLNTAILTALIAALLSLLTAFGVPITAEQQEAINQVVLIAAPLVVGFIARQYVTPIAQPRDNEGIPLVRIDGTKPVVKS